MAAQVLVAIVLGILLGWISGSTGPMIGDADRFTYSLVGGLFMNALKMIAVPLVMISIILGLAELGDRPALPVSVLKPSYIMWALPWSPRLLAGVGEPYRPGEGGSLAPDEISSWSVVASKKAPNGRDRTEDQWPHWQIVSTC